jgi:hypothetical protein
MKTTHCLVLSLGLMAVATASARAQHAGDIDKAFKPLEFRTATPSIFKVPAISEVQPGYRTSAIGDLAILGPMRESVSDFLSWADRLHRDAKSPGGIRLSDGSILRLDGHDLMISPTNHFLKRNGITYGIAKGLGVAGPALRFKF